MSVLSKKKDLLKHPTHTWPCVTLSTAADLMENMSGAGEFPRPSIDPETITDRSGLKNDAESRQNQLRRPMLRPFHGHFEFRNIIIGRVWVPIGANEGYTSLGPQTEYPP